jgi:hypothetical protein
MDELDAVRQADVEVATLTAHAAEEKRPFIPGKPVKRIGRSGCKKSTANLMRVWRFLPENKTREIANAMAELTLTLLKKGHGRSARFLIEALNSMDPPAVKGAGVNLNINNQQASLPSLPEYAVAVRQLRDMERRALPLNGEARDG